MAPQMSKDALKKLMIGPRVSVSHRQDEDRPARIISELIPKPVLIHFAPIFRDTLTITGGDKNILKSVLEWMKSCCGGKGMVDYPTTSVTPFTTCVLVTEALEIIGKGSHILAALRQEMIERCNHILAKQVSVADVRAVYTELEAKSHATLRARAIESVGNARFENRLSGLAEYETFAGKNEAFRSDLDQYLAKLHAPKEEEKRARKKAYWAGLKEKSKKAEAERIFAQQEPGVKVVTVEKVVDRKGRWKLDRDDFLLFDIDTRRRA